MDNLQSIVTTWWVLFIIGTLFLAIRMYFLDNDKSVFIPFILKVASSFLFVFFAFFVLSETEKLININFSVTTEIDIFYIFFGLIVCMLGDMIIAIRNIFKKNSYWNQIIFALGAILFFVAHFMYLVALWGNNSFLLISIFASAVVAIIIIWCINKAWEVKSYAGIVLFLYLSLAFCVVFHAFFRFDINNIGTVLFVVGMVLFLISDGLLVVAIFLKSDKTIKLSKKLQHLKLNTVIGAFVIPIYFWGQMVISLSLVWLKV